MGWWGANSDENDDAADDTIDVKKTHGLYSDAEECVELEDQARADAMDAALLPKEVEYGFFGTILGFLREGYRLSGDALDEAEVMLRAEVVEGSNWFDDGVSRRAAIAEELTLIEAARANDGKAPPEALEGCESKGLIEAILERTVHDVDADSDADAASEASVITGPHGDAETVAQLPPPYAWLDAAPLKTLVRIAKTLGVPLTGGIEKPELVATIKAHPDRWAKARNEAPYVTCAPPPTEMEMTGAVPAGCTASGVPIHKKTMPTGEVMTYYGKAGHEAIGKVVSADGNCVVNYEGGAGEEHKTRAVLTKKDITVYYKGPRGAEYKWKECQGQYTFYFEGTQPDQERKVSQHKGRDVITFDGERGEERIVTIERRTDGMLDEYEGVRGEEHLVTKTDKHGTVTRYAGSKGEETPVTKTDTHGNVTRYTGPKGEETPVDAPAPAARAPATDSKKSPKKHEAATPDEAIARSVANMARAVGDHEVAEWCMAEVAPKKKAKRTPKRK